MSLRRELDRLESENKKFTVDTQENKNQISEKEVRLRHLRERLSEL